MPFQFGSATPTIGDEFAFGGKTYRYGGMYWSAVNLADQVPGSNGSAAGFFVGTEVLWKEVLVTAGLEGIVVNSLGTELTYI
jgi:hypothetical protein